MALTAEHQTAIGRLTAAQRALARYVNLQLTDGHRFDRPDATLARLADRPDSMGAAERERWTRYAELVEARDQARAVVAEHEAEWRATVGRGVVQPAEVTT